MSTHDARISPVFRYAHAHAAIAWLEHAYGLTRHEVHEGEGHTIAHADLRLGAGGIALSSAGPEVDGQPWTRVRSGIYVCTADVDRVHDRARAAGADIAQPIQDTSYGAREFSVRDPGGHLWSFGTWGVSSAADRPNIFIGLHYQQGPAALAWLQQALGFEPTLVVQGQPGVIEHAELALGGSVIMITSAPYSVGDAHTDRQTTYVRVDDPDAHYARARAAGAAILREPFDTPFGARDYYTRDMEGFLWGFSTYAPQPSPSALRRN